MVMQVCEDVVLVNPIGDGQDYHAGMEIELSDAVALDWARRGWVRRRPERGDSGERANELQVPHKEGAIFDDPGARASEAGRRGDR